MILLTVKNSLASLCFVTLFFCFFASPISAAPLRGRLPDGRAFRTDAQGVQLTDYIAELELSVEALNKKILELERKVDECEAPEDRIGVIEKDVLTGKVICPTTAAVQAKLQKSDEKIAQLQIELLQARQKSLILENTPMTATNNLSAEEKINALTAELKAAQIKNQASKITHKPVNKNSVRSAYHHLQALIAKRRTAYQRYTLKNHNVNFELTPTRTRDYDLETLRVAIDKTNDQKSLQQLGQAVSDITKKVEDDLALISRLANNKH